MDAVRNAEMERAIDADPSDASFLVYADWLQSHGDPHDELIVVNDNFIPTAVMSELRRTLPQVSGPAQLEDEDEHRCALCE